MIPYIVYSHTSYLKVLEAQTHQLKSIDNKILLVNESDEDLSALYSEYKQVLFYDDSLPYASRLLKLSELDIDYALFIHDIDVVIYSDNNTIDHLVDKMKELDIDRIDLQYQQIHKTSNKEGELIDIELEATIEGTTLQIPRKWENPDDKRFYITKQDDVNYYIYNVNPSIWKISTLIELMTNFKDETYRSIENPSTQYFCQKYKVYKCFGPYILSGGFCCMPFFQFIHVTHGGKLLPLTDNNLDGTIHDKYITLLSQFKLDENREFQTNNIASERWCPHHYGPIEWKVN